MICGRRFRKYKKSMIMLQERVTTLQRVTQQAPSENTHKSLRKRKINSALSTDCKLKKSNQLGQLHLRIIKSSLN